MENGQFEGVFPIERRDVRLPEGNLFLGLLKVSR